MRCSVFDRDILAGAIARREMNYGQPIAGREALPYLIELLWEDFLSAVGEPYAKLLDELVADEPYDEGLFAEVNELRAMGWPSIEVLANRDESLLLRVTREFLDMVLLDRILFRSDTNRMELAFLINSIESIERHGDVVHVIGMAYPVSGWAGMLPSTESGGQ
jgi:hypothetical protein